MVWRVVAKGGVFRGIENICCHENGSSPKLGRCAGGHRRGSHATDKRIAHSLRHEILMLLISVAVLQSFAMFLQKLVSELGRQIFAGTITAYDSRLMLWS